MKRKNSLSVSAWLVVCGLILVAWGCGHRDSSWVPFPDPLGKQDDLDPVTYLDEELKFETPVSGEFSADLEAHGWWFELKKEATITLVITRQGTSERVDTSLFVYGPLDKNGSLGEVPIASDDDSGWGYNPRLDEITLKAGRYLVVVATWDGLGRGHYRLEIRCGSRNADD